MDKLEFNAQVLARALAAERLAIQTDAFQQIALNMVRERCCQALWEIRMVLDDESLSDLSCLAKIAGVISALEEPASDTGSRHDA